jgi:hypothetical protein
MFVVPSHRLIRKEGFLPSEEFIRNKIEDLKPRGVIGAVCLPDFQRKYLPGVRLRRGGVVKDQINQVIPQGLILNTNRCLGNDLDWQKLIKILS